MLRNGFVAAALMCALAGCGGQPAATPTATPTAAQTAGTNTTVAETGTATPAATPTETGTPEDAEYKKLKKEAESLTLGKGYSEALPLLKKCLEMHPEDPQIHFYLMLANGNLEAEPDPKSEAYANAKKVLELAPNDPMAERAKDYIISAESEAKPLKDNDSDSLYGKTDPFKTDPRAMYTMPEAAIMLPTNLKRLTVDLKKKLWYLEVRPDAVTEKLELPKGTKVSIAGQDEFDFSRNSWRGGPQAPPSRYDETWFYLIALNVRVEEGPNEGKIGWMTNQMERFAGYDEKANPTFTVKVGPRLPLATL